MAARSVLQSIPRHRLKALESMQADADEANAATKARALLQCVTVNLVLKP